MVECVTKLMERAARLISANPHLTKTEVARRLGCSRRSINNWMGEEEFTDFLEDLNASTRPDIPALVEDLSSSERKTLIERLREETGQRVPEIERIEELIYDTRGFLDVDAVAEASRALGELVHGSKGTEFDCKRELERLEGALDAKAPGWREVYEAVREGRGVGVRLGTRGHSLFGEQDESRTLGWEEEEDE